MTSGTWLHDHESLAALIFIVLSLGLTGIFAWLEQRFLPHHAGAERPPQRGRIKQTV